MVQGATKTTIHAVMMAIQAKRGTPPGSMRLIFDGGMLLPQDKLEKVGIEENSRIDMMISIRGS